MALSNHSGLLWIVWWKRHVGLSPQGEFSTAPATPALPGDGIPLGGKLPATVWEPPGYKSRPDKKYSKKSEKNEDFKNTREHRFISQLVITIGFR